MSKYTNASETVFTLADFCLNSELDSIIVTVHNHQIMEVYESNELLKLKEVDLKVKESNQDENGSFITSINA